MICAAEFDSLMLAVSASQLEMRQIKSALVGHHRGDDVQRRGKQEQ